MDWFKTMTGMGIPTGRHCKEGGRERTLFLLITVTVFQWRLILSPANHWQIKTDREEKIEVTLLILAGQLWGTMVRDFEQRWSVLLTVTVTHSTSINLLCLWLAFIKMYFSTVYPVSSADLLVWLLIFRTVSELCISCRCLFSWL